MSSLSTDASKSSKVKGLWAVCLRIHFPCYQDKFQMAGRVAKVQNLDSVMKWNGLLIIPAPSDQLHQHVVWADFLITLQLHAASSSEHRSMDPVVHGCLWTPQVVHLLQNPVGRLVLTVWTWIPWDIEMLQEDFWLYSEGWSFVFWFYFSLPIVFLILMQHLF